MTESLAVKLAKVEQQVTDQSSKIGEIYTDVKEIKECIANGNYDKRLTRLENKSNFWMWLSPTLAAIFGSFITFLIIKYFESIK